MKALPLLILTLALSSCEFEKADYYEYRYGSNVDFGQDVGNSSGSSFDFGSSFKARGNTGSRLYMGTTGTSTSGQGTKTNYSRYYRGSSPED